VDVSGNSPADREAFASILFQYNITLDEYETNAKASSIDTIVEGRLVPANKLPHGFRSEPEDDVNSVVVTSDEAFKVSPEYT